MQRFTQILLWLPGWFASLLMIAFTAFWSYWGVGEMYHEGWWGAWYNRLPYLVPTALTLIPALIAFRWPIGGGSLIIALALGAFLSFGSGVAPIFLAIALVGAAFLADGLIQRWLARRAASIEPQGSAALQATDAFRPASAPSRAPRRVFAFWLHNWRYILLIGLPLLIFLGASAVMLPIVLTRVDDGNRSARLIEGNGVALVWAPEGPGWNWLQPWGGYPAWQRIALYGVAPVGFDDKPGFGPEDGDDATVRFATSADMAAANLCQYLSRDGTTLHATPQEIWRMPTTDEVVRSLVRHGESAGCVWRGEFRSQVDCAVLPDKESPLWAADQPVIYYWTADAYDERRGYYVAYNGAVNAAYKLGGNPRHGYRCVREP